MEKEQNLNQDNTTTEPSEESNESKTYQEENLNQDNTTTEPSEESNESKTYQEENLNKSNEEEKKEISPEEKVIKLEDKLARTFAEMENQRRRFEKEKDDAFDYGGFTFAKEALNLIDNLARSKLILESDESL